MSRPSVDRSAVRLSTFFVLTGIAFLVPSLLSPYLTRVGTVILVVTVGACGLNLILGYTGIFSFGNAAFVGIGGYVTASLLIRTGLPFWLVIALSMITGAAAGALVGLITWRVSGDYFALVTLGFGATLYLVMNNWEFIGGSTGLPGIPAPSLFGIEIQSNEQIYYFSLVVGLLVLLFVRKLGGSNFGRALLAIREDELAARACGINTRQTKLVVFAVGSGISGLAGVLQVTSLGFISPASFTLDASVLAVEVVIIGGMAYAWGPLIGSFVLIGIAEWARVIADYRVGIFGALMILILVVRPDGLAGILGLSGARPVWGPGARAMTRRLSRNASVGVNDPSESRDGTGVER